MQVRNVCFKARKGRNPWVDIQPAIWIEMNARVCKSKLHTPALLWTNSEFAVSYFTKTLKGLLSTCTTYIPAGTSSDGKFTPCMLKTRTWV